ncbi:MAG: diacylglycerol kinase [Omnitrophica bacterium]|nr:diacylglycerol kinase [Candidatus Omnitrophota bacterium]
MKKRNITKSLNSAVEGFIYVLRTQRNMRVHFLVAILVLVFAIYLNLPKDELLILLAAITLVLVVEMVNTAIELTIDLVKSVYHPLARAIKDVTAGAVFLSALNAAVVGYIIFSRHFALYTKAGIVKIMHSPWHLTFIALLLLLSIVVCGKVFFQKGTPFRGGMPSGHAAFAFSMWTVIAFSTGKPLIILLSFVMAFLIARHRLTDGVHSFWEIIAGAALGTLVTTLVFQLLI